MIETVPNVSEGRRPDVLAELLDAVAGEPGAWLLDHSADPSHHRSVFTLAGDADALEAALLRLVGTAVARIDLRSHTGAHPRFGAVDVIPFIPLGNTTLAACVDVSRRVGRAIAERFGVPIFLYEASATHPERQRLEHVRRGGFEGLAEKMRRPEWTPDFGPSAPHPTAGATAVGARRPLIAYNINLESSDVEIARQIAAVVRESGGGLAGVKALGLGLAHRGVAQVSMNLTDVTRTSIQTVFDAVQREAHARGVLVRESELIGLIPESALAGTTPERLKLTGFTRSHILEVRLAERMAGR